MVLWCLMDDLMTVGTQQTALGQFLLHQSPTTIEEVGDAELLVPEVVEHQPVEMLVPPTAGAFPSKEAHGSHLHPDLVDPNVACRTTSTPRASDPPPTDRAQPIDIRPIDINLGVVLPEWGTGQAELSTFQVPGLSVDGYLPPDLAAALPTVVHARRMAQIRSLCKL
jgi:hypothetical protein